MSKARTGSGIQRGILFHIGVRMNPNYPDSPQSRRSPSTSSGLVYTGVGPNSSALILLLNMGGYKHNMSLTCVFGLRQFFLLLFSFVNSCYYSQRRRPSTKHYV